MTTELQTDPPATTHAPARVLVVDDERSMRELLSIVLRRDGYDVLIAEDARGGRSPSASGSISSSRHPMPQMNGVDLLREASASPPTSSAS